ncbi:MAG: amino acid--tRNA ligase-related protein [Candidatus Roizmanbacteria bacterium]
MIKKTILKVEGKKVTLDFLDHVHHLVAINESLVYGAADHYRHVRGLIYVDVPAIVGITGACENVDTLFKVGNRLDLPLFFSQTGQLALEQALQTIHGAWTVIHSGRDETEEDARHLRQFRLTEEEADCTLAGMTRKNYDEDAMYEFLLANIQGVVQAMLTSIIKHHGDVLRTVYKRDITKLTYAAKHPFARILYEDAVKLLNTNGFPSLKFGDDLGSAQEAKIVQLVNKPGQELPVFIMKYPKEIKFFNMKVSGRDQRVVLSADLIFPYAGEGTGASVREHDFAKLNTRLLTSQMYKLHLSRGGKYKDFKWYLDIIKSKTPFPHAGYGIGNDRVLQYVLGTADIHHGSLFAQLNEQTEDWDKAKYGQAGFLTKQNKHILLSIGTSEDKAALRDVIDHLSQGERYVLYATKHTHEYLKKAGIITSQVYKVSEDGKPNIADMIASRSLDLIINIPTRLADRDEAMITDGKKIRTEAVSRGINLITDIEVAKMVIEKLAQE